MTTIEGLAQNGTLYPLQEAFVRHGAIQCGFCTPGMIMMAEAFLRSNPTPTEIEVRKGISGNLCGVQATKRSWRQLWPWLKGAALVACHYSVEDCLLPQPSDYYPTSSLRLVTWKDLPYRCRKAAM